MPDHKIVITVLVITCAVFVNYIIYHYRMTRHNLNVEHGVSNIENGDSEHESNTETVQSDLKENDKCEGKEQLKMCTTSHENIYQSRLESVHEIQESVVADMQLMKNQMKELREKQDLMKLNVFESEEYGRFVEEMRKDITAGLDKAESFVFKMDTKVADLWDTFKEFYNESYARLETLNETLIRFTTETNITVNGIRHSIKEMHRHETDLDAKIQKIVAEIMTLKETSESTTTQVDDLLMLVGNRIHPNTINKSMTAVVFLGIFTFIMIVICFVYCQVTKVSIETDSMIKELKTTLRKELETTIRMEIETALRKEREKLERLNFVKTGDDKVNEVAGRK